MLITERASQLSISPHIVYNAPKKEEPFVYDTLQTFVFEHHHIRGHIVHLGAAYRAILDCHPYPYPIQTLLGESLSAVALLRATVKFQGSVILQIQTKGSISQLVAQCHDPYHVRGLALWDEALPEEALSFGPGHLAITLFPEKSSDRYQGVVALQEGTIASHLEHYFEQSEQLPTKLWLFADKEVAAGLLLQKMPSDSGEDYAPWETACVLASTLSKEELLHLETTQLLHRLFHEEDLRLFAPHPVSFQCGCTLDKMERAVIQLGFEDAQKLLSTHKTIEVTCEFCNRRYVFDSVDVAKLFKI